MIKKTCCREPSESLIITSQILDGIIHRAFNCYYSNWIEKQIPIFVPANTVGLIRDFVSIGHVVNDKSEESHNSQLRTKGHDWKIGNEPVTLITHS